MAADLARHPRFRWQPGMAYFLDGERHRMVGDSPSASLLSFGVLDLTDDATAGILLALAAAAAPRRLEIHIGGTVAGCRIRMLGRHKSPARPREQQSSWTGDTLGAACAAALISLWSHDGR